MSSQLKHRVATANATSKLTTPKALTASKGVTKEAPSKRASASEPTLSGSTSVAKRHMMPNDIEAANIPIVPSASSSKPLVKPKSTNGMTALKSKAAPTVPITLAPNPPVAKPKEIVKGNSVPENNNQPATTASTTATRKGKAVEATPQDLAMQLLTKDMKRDVPPPPVSKKSVGKGLAQKHTGQDNQVLTSDGVVSVATNKTGSVIYVGGIKRSVPVIERDSNISKGYGNECAPTRDTSPTCTHLWDDSGDGEGCLTDLDIIPRSREKSVGPNARSSSISDASSFDFDKHGDDPNKWQPKGANLQQPTQSNGTTSESSGLMTEVLGYYLGTGNDQNSFEEGNANQLQPDTQQTSDSRLGAPTPDPANKRPFIFPRKKSRVIIWNEKLKEPSDGSSTNTSLHTSDISTSDRTHNHEAYTYAQGGHLPQRSALATSKRKAADHNLDTTKHKRQQQEVAVSSDKRKADSDLGDAPAAKRKELEFEPAGLFLSTPNSPYTQINSETFTGMTSTLMRRLEEEILQPTSGLTSLSSTQMAQLENEVEPTLRSSRLYTMAGNGATHKSHYSHNVKTPSRTGLYASTNTSPSRVKPRMNPVPMAPPPKPPARKPVLATKTPIPQPAPKPTIATKPPAPKPVPATKPPTPKPALATKPPTPKSIPKPVPAPTKPTTAKPALKPPPPAKPAAAPPPAKPEPASAKPTTTKPALRTSTRLLVKRAQK